ncbi:hypothetical protein HQN86_01480 [Pedobacter panaciterrae]|uniref:hypothetical protein n=1 Tax=Pedobacter panaciterrae TaxID=363849 RepID=UPI00155DA165|nr:hypothetical protein [Pedobacter panaciterrae]NQX52275.1 hypothetical protein [Pedobacter panaciterrae]
MKRSFLIENFLKRAAYDSRLLPSHLSLFMAVFYFSPADDPKAEFRVCRRKLMRYSRIRSISTYHKCMSDLVVYGYVTYQPSYDPFRASLVSLIHWDHE